MASASQVPVINALTDRFHPCQVLADLQTGRQHKKRLAGLTLAYLGDGANNMAHSYLLGGSSAGMHIRIGAPHAYQPDPQIMADAAHIAAATGGSVAYHDAAEQAVDGADVVATDTWVSMGQEGEAGDRSGPFVAYAVTTRTMSYAAPDAVVLHCLPAYRGKEIDTEVIDGPQSIVWDEAENRRHAQKALLTWLLEDGGAS
jgi:ornithine carbamoyltransferase